MMKQSGPSTSSAPVDAPRQERLPSGKSLAVVAALALGVSCLAISNQSFWIDEAATCLTAQQPTLAAWWHKVSHSGGDVQQPLYFLFTWVWMKSVPINEFVVRFGNVLWFLPGVLAMFCALAGNPRLRWSFSAVLLSSPFLWYYINDSRPYAMQVALSLVVFAALYRLSWPQQDAVQQRRWVITLCVGSLLFSAASMLAMLWLGAYFLATVLSTPSDRRRRFVRDYRVYWALTLSLLFFLGLYYLWTVVRGSRGCPEKTDLRNVAFIPYELLGFDGLGPGRLAIRNDGLAAFLPWVPLLAIYGAVVLSVLIQGWKQIVTFTSRWTRIRWLVVLTMLAVFILALGAKLQWRVLARHCTPMLAPSLFVLAAGVARLLNRRNWMGVTLAVAFVGLNLVSDLNLRFSERHAKEDYRSAAAIASAAITRGERVWWCADGSGATYYGVPLSQPNMPPAPGEAYTLLVRTDPLVTIEPPPQVVVYSSKIEHDPKQQLRRYLEQHHYSLSLVLPSFTIWRMASHESDHDTAVQGASGVSP
jgi:hypothetical protein